MPDKITYYAIIGGGSDQQPVWACPATRNGRGFTDEALRKDFSWCFTPVIVEWERGDFADELVEVSHEQASKIIEYFREQWGPFGQPLDP